MPNILKGIHESMASAAKLLRSAGAEGVVLMTGGLAADDGLLEAMKEAVADQKLKDFEIRTHRDGEYAVRSVPRSGVPSPVRAPAREAGGVRVCRRSCGQEPFAE